MARDRWHRLAWACVVVGACLDGVPGVAAAQGQAPDAQPAATAEAEAAPVVSPEAPVAAPEVEGGDGGTPTAAPPQAAEPPAPAEPPPSTGQSAYRAAPSDLGKRAAAEYHQPQEPPDGIDLSRFPDKSEARREGFTLELGLGLGVTRLSVDGGDSVTNVGLAPLSLSFGAFLSPKLALMFRLGGTAWFEDVPEGDAQVGSYFYGPAVQYWLNDRIFLGAGAGLGRLAVDVLWSSGMDYRSETGLSLLGRVGVNLTRLRHHSVAFVFEAYPTFYGDIATYGFAFNLQWQLF